jgi:uncharacterized protein YdeI (YjbR/CyaY-like superfamily)
MATKTADQMHVVTAYTVADFSAWLKVHHESEDKMKVLVHKKHTGKSSPSHRELIEEAIAYGWIDTTIKRIDDDTYLRHFSKRNKNSKWSDNTLRYALKVIQEGRMTEQGMFFYEQGRNKETHDHGIPKDPDMPPDLKHALAKDKDAQAVMDAIAPSKQRTLFRWILRAKLPSTKEKRVKQIVDCARKGDTDFGFFISKDV